MIKVLVVGSFRYEIYAKAFYDAFKSLGHDVIKIDYDDYCNLKKVGLEGLFNKIQNKILYGPAIRNYNKKIIKEVSSRKPDFVFLYRCSHIYDKTVKEIRKHSVVFTYNNDDPFGIINYDKRFISNAKHCDLIYVYRPKNVDDFARIGITKTKILLPYYMKSRNFHIECTKDIPIAFVGHFEDDGRDELIRVLYKEGLPVRIYGEKSWKNSKYYEELKPIISKGAIGADYNLLLNRIKINLVFLSKINCDKYTRRCFEIPAVKGMMLSEYTEEMDELFPNRECAYYFHNKEELVEFCKYLLNHEEEIKRVGDNAYEQLIKNGGDEIVRAQQIVDDFNMINNV